MHEQSETIKGRDGQWYNIYGQGTGAPQPIPLPKLFGFEQTSYPTEGEAANKAAWRSQLGEGHYSMNAPEYGITNTYQPSPQAKALGKVIEVLQDPRNSWMGGGMLRGMRLLKPIPTGPEMGGFRETTKSMRTALNAPRPNLRAGEVPSTEQALRNDYLGEITGTNQIAKALMSPLSPIAERDLEALAAQGERFDIKSIPKLEETLMGLNQLKNDTSLKLHSTYTQEGPPPDSMLKRFGFE